MGKKGKKDKRKGAEKTAQKLAKKDQKSEGMEDLEAMIAQFQVLDKKLTTFNEEKVTHPSSRSNLSVTPHPDKDELILFGGEYLKGDKTLIYNDVFVYNIKKNEWSKQFYPNPPPPRSSHQAVAVSKEGGQLWVFGGEFSSPNGGQFYHYKDLWLLLLKERTWEQINSGGGPSQRSGHRMILYKKSIFVFGGFQECNKNFVYFNDCYMFSLTEYKWTKLSCSGTGPCFRSACQLTLTPNGILVVGGYSKVRVKKDVEKGTAHTDMFLLSEESDSKMKWSRIKDSGNKPWPRSGFSLAQMAPTRSVMFGGVCDEEEEEDLDSFFFNSLSCLDLVSYRWFPMELRKSKPPKKKGTEKDDAEADLKDEKTSSPKADVASSSQPSTSTKTVILPCARMNALTAIKRNTLFVYGGIYEEDDKQITLNDLWSIDLKKMESWVQLVESDDTSTDWCEEENDDSTDDESSDKEATDNQHPPLEEDEDSASYWFRNREHWLEEASNEAEENERADVIRHKAKELAKAYFKTASK